MESEKKGFIPRAGLAQTNAHHETMGSSHRNLPVTPENLHRPNHEFLNDDELRAYVEKELSTIREEHGKLADEAKSERSGMSHVDMYRMLRDKFLFPNLRYLDGIGRLPEGIDLAALEVELAIPDGIE